MTMHIYVKAKKRRREEFQFFMHDFTDACRAAGYGSRPDILPSYRWKIRALCRELLWRVYTLLRRRAPRLLRRREALIVAANGSNLIDNSFPYWGRYEIVPMLWDTWPDCWPRLLASLRALDVRTCLVTSGQVAEMLRREAGIRACHIPEGITETHYGGGVQPLQRARLTFSRWDAACPDTTQWWANWPKRESCAAHPRATPTRRGCSPTDR